MAAPTDFTADIATQAVEPASSAGDGQSATARPIGDLIAVDRYTLAKASAAQRGRGLRFTKIIAPGCVPDNGGSAVVGVPFGGGVWG